MPKNRPMKTATAPVRKSGTILSSSGGVSSTRQTVRQILHAQRLLAPNPSDLRRTGHLDLLDQARERLRSTLGKIERLALEDKDASAENLLLSRAEPDSPCYQMDGNHPLRTPRMRNEPSK